MRKGKQVAWADEMRLGLLGRVRRVWGIRGIKIRQKVECTYEWRYLSLAVDGVAGQLWWQWTPDMKKETVQGVVAEWQARGIEALVWDRAPSHRAKMVRAVGLPLIEQPTAAPELNPAERVFEELRREAEGDVYGTIEKKMAVVEGELKALAAAPERVQQLTGWSWIRDTLSQLPQEFTALSQRIGITYVRLRLEFVYLAVLLDVFTQCIRGWYWGPSLSQGLTLIALQRALVQRLPEIHHSDQGVQDAATVYVQLLEEAGVRISMAEVGQAWQNGYAERIMRTSKEEEVDLSEYQDYWDAYRQIGQFLEDVYMKKRVHASLGYRTPVEFESQWLAQQGVPEVVH